jgi:hypothetical protein
MLTTIKGTYSNGQVTLLEPPPTEETTEVLVTFTHNEPTKKTPKQPEFGFSKGEKPRMPGFSKGTVLYMAPDFDAPLGELNDYM